ncbi:MAG: hypothetical protein ACK2U9_11415 [Anaerolineae bacterium]
MRRSKRPRRLETSVDLPFAAGIHQLPPHHRPSLLVWLRRYARTLRRLDPAVAPARQTCTFYQLDPTTGTWEQL